MYKTIVLQLLENQRELFAELQRQRKVLPTMERCARELKELHESWKDLLSRRRPWSDPIQIASDAMEIALGELQNRWPFDPSASEEDSESAEAVRRVRRSSAG